MTKQNDLGTARELATLVVRTAGRVKAEFAQAVMVHDFPPPLARALLLLDAPATMGTLAGQLSCDQSYVTRLADDLEQRCLIARTPGEDRRVQVLTLTPEGLALKAKLAEAVSSQSSLITALTPKEQSELRALLMRILEAAPVSCPSPQTGSDLSQLA